MLDAVVLTHRSLLHIPPRHLLFSVNGFALFPFLLSIFLPLF